MRVRHKIPNVVSLSMMDVLCCALGCVILLWLLGAKQTEDETSELRTARSREINEYDANDESGFNTFAERDEKSREQERTS